VSCSSVEFPPQNRHPRSYPRLGRSVGGLPRPDELMAQVALLHNCAALLAWEQAEAADSDSPLHDLGLVPTSPGSRGGRPCVRTPRSCRVRRTPRPWTQLSDGVPLRKFSRACRTRCEARTGSLVGR
jgi:hypothetical protein